jgi:hypothetical protein
LWCSVTTRHVTEQTLECDLVLWTDAGERVADIQSLRAQHFTRERLAQLLHAQTVHADFSSSLYEIEWQNLSLDAHLHDNQTKNTGFWLVLAESETDEALQPWLRALQQTGNQYQVVDSTGFDVSQWLTFFDQMPAIPIVGVLHAWPLYSASVSELNDTYLLNAQKQNCETLLILIQALQQRFEMQMISLMGLTRSAIAFNRETVSLDWRKRLYWV